VPTIPASQGGYDPKFMTSTQQTQIAPSFETLIGKTPGQYDEMRTYKNDAGATLQIPFKNGQPIYPIPEGYTFVDPEEEQTEKPTVQSVRPTTTTTTGEGGDDTGARVGTTRVGKTGELIDTRFGSQSPEKIKESFGKMTEAQRGLAVINSMESARGSSTLMRNLATGMLGVAGGPLGMVAGAYDTGSRLMGGQGLGLGASQPDALNNIVNAYGYFEEDTDPDGTKESYLNSLSQAVYGLNYEDATSKLGVAPTFKKGFKPGEIDPRTGGTYDKYGQSTTDEGGVSYSSFSDAGKGFAAMAASGFMGGAKDAERVANKTTASAKDRARAQAYLDYLNKEDKDDDKKPDDRFRSPSDVGGKPSKQTQPDPIDYSPPTTVGDPSYSTPSNVISASSFGDEPGDDTDSSPSGDPGGGFGGSSEGDFGFTATGGLMDKNKIIMKKKPKVKKMKRGGLASKK
jgi:hypothetical protein